jgi:hypothetical protein
MLRLELGGHVNLPRHADERVFGRLVTVRGREQRRALDVRVVVGAPGGDIDQPDAQVFEQVKELVRLG